MRERPYEGRIPDGDRVPGPRPPERPALTRRQYAYGVTVALLVLGLLVLGLVR
ncbi:hypothetical protein O7602_18580 [Micromonospora sp. WMMD1128]|uniref:hypothetical protein n=1 Tax=Micromonospora sp. WMMD1128 TaxID=3015150 RepID=UPI00248CD7E0|nr:hypothetical protein [Micromonospora sp. WMMD1128]WBB71742.1 hypothetical protein O7602_18580 [Micromonospora sp. WMMD1128]